MSDSVKPHRWQPPSLHRPWDSPGKNTGVGWHFLLQCMKVKSESEVAQSCATLHDPMDCSLPGSSVHAIFQARVLEWGAIAFSASDHPNQQYPGIQKDELSAVRQKHSLRSPWTLCFLCHFCQCKESSEHLGAIFIRGICGRGAGSCLQTPFQHPWKWPMYPPALSQELEVPSKKKKKSEQFAIAPSNGGISRIQVLSLSSNLSTMENYC